MDLADLQRDYLADVETTIATMREQGRALGERGAFKDAFPKLLFLDDERVDRPTPAELSRKIVALTDELAREVHSAACPASSSS